MSLIMKMACNDDELVSKDPLEEEKGRVMYNVTRMRKLFPQKCSQFLSKRLKMEHHILETTGIILEASENLPEDFEESEESDTEMVTDVSNAPVDKLALLNGFSELEKDLDDILKVLEQVKTEKDNGIFQTCSQGLSSSPSFNKEEKQ